MPRLLRSTVLRHALVYFGIFAAVAAVAVAYIFWRTNVLMAANLETAIYAEIRSLDDQFRMGGVEQLRRAIAERSETPGNSLYLVAGADGRWLAGNLKEVSPGLWNTIGRVIFVYRRPAGSGTGTEERLAFANVFRLAGGARLIVGRDIEDQREFGRIVRNAFLWTLAGMALLGFGGSVLMNRRLLRRLAAITETSRTIMAGDLTRRVPLAGTGDEFDRLAENLNAMLQRIGELIDGFKAVSDNIAHDLKTPLSRLRNRTETALREARGEEAYREALQAAIDDADDLIKTFDALLSIARLEAGAAANSRARFALDEVVADVCELYEPVAEESGLVLTYTPAPETFIEGERQLIAQALANVIDNAIKYGAPSAPREGDGGGAKPEIAVRLVPNGQWADVIVADHGPGIPSADRERVLQRFVRLEASRSRPGSGLGLSLAAAVARLHGGRLTLGDNAPGLTVTLSLRREV